MPRSGLRFVVRSSVLLLACVAVLGGASAQPLAATQAPSVFSTRGTIVRLAADGSRVAASTKGIKGACDRIVVWSAPQKTFRRFDAHTHCPKADAALFEYVGELALGGGRLAWIEGGGGNNLDLLLYAAPLSGAPRSAKNLDYATNGNGAGEDIAGDYLGQLFGSGPLLVYNRWTRCSLASSEGVPTAACPKDGQISAEKLLRIGAGKPAPVRSGPTAWQLVAVGGGRVAIRAQGATKTDGDSLTIRGGASGSLVTTVPAKPNQAIRAVALSAGSLVVQRTHSLDVYNPASGAALATYPLGQDSSLLLVGSDGHRALLRGLRQLRLVRLDNGKRSTLPLAPDTARCPCPVDAKLTAGGLFYAYNVPRSSARGRIVFWSPAALAAAG